jgi:hypothetical protein
MLSSLAKSFMFYIISYLCLLICGFLTPLSLSLRCDIPLCLVSTAFHHQMALAVHACEKVPRRNQIQWSKRNRRLFAVLWKEHCPQLCSAGYRASAVARKLHRRMSMGGMATSLKNGSVEPSGSLQYAVQHEWYLNTPLKNGSLEPSGSS